MQVRQLKSRGPGLRQIKKSRTWSATCLRPGLRQVGDLVSDKIDLMEFGHNTANIFVSRKYRAQACFFGGAVATCYVAVYWWQQSGPVMTTEMMRSMLIWYSNSCLSCIVKRCHVTTGVTTDNVVIPTIYTYTVNHKKGGSTFVIITLENLDGF